MDGELQRFEERRRRVYIAALLLVIAVLQFAWVVRGPDDSYRAWSSPLAALALGTLVAMLRQGRIALARLELAMLLVVVALPLARQFWLFHFAGPVDEQWLRLLGNNDWSISAVIVVVCTITERRRGLAAVAVIGRPSVRHRPHAIAFAEEAP